MEDARTREQLTRALTDTVSKDTLRKMGLFIKTEKHMDRSKQTPMWSWMEPNTVHGHATSVDMLDVNPGTKGVCADWISDVCEKSGKHWVLLCGDGGEVIQ